MALSTAIQRRTGRQAHPASVRRLTLAANLTLTLDDAEVQILDGDGAARDVYLPEVSREHAGIEHWIQNAGTGADDILVETAAEASVVTLVDGAIAQVYVTEAGAWALGLHFVPGA